MSLNAQPPFKHSVRLRGTLVKQLPGQGGTRISLHHGNEVYKVFVPEDVQKEDAIEHLVGGPVELWAKKDRKVGGWLARTELVRGNVTI